MSPKNFKDFLTIGLCLQTGPDSFKVLIGPFTLVPMEEIHTSKSSTFLYKAEFWDFIKTDVFTAQNFVYKASEAFDLNREEIIRLLQKEVSETASLEWQPAAEQGFKEQFDWSQKLFKNNVVKKTVPVISQSCHTGIGENLKIAMLLNLLKQKSFGWTYAYFENGKGFIGHTPEILLEWNRKAQMAQTVALAGTLANIPGAKAVISDDAKIRQEHNYVIDDLQLKLSSFHAEREKTEVLELKHLLHLQTRFNIPMKDLSTFITCIQLLHPTAAMGVYPHNAEVLKEMSLFELQKNRGPFAGPIGIVDQNQALVVVPIRGIMFNDDGASIYSGCGVTAESQYESEIQELENKRNSVKKMLGLMND